MADDKKKGHPHETDSQRDTRAILNRRAFLIKSSIAGAGLGLGACKRNTVEEVPTDPQDIPPEVEQPQICLSEAPIPEPRPCLSVPEPEPDPGPEFQTCLEIAPDPEPHPCLKIRPREMEPQVCLKMAPETMPEVCLKVAPEACLSIAPPPEPSPQPCLSMRAPDVEDEKAAHAVVRAAMPAVRRCYRERVGSDQPAGRIKVRIEVEGGAATSKVLEDSVGLGVADCIIAILNKLSFAGCESTTMVQSFVFPL